MIFDSFKDIFFKKILFQTKEIGHYFDSFDKNNLTRWCKQGVLIKLRNGFYSFPEYLKNQEATFYIANRIYPFSYISLHSALFYHGFVTNPLMNQISSVGGKKTMDFKNHFGKFNYQSMKDSLLFGYQEINKNNTTFLMATPEKAILDLFYLYPHYYDTVQGIRHFALEGQKLYEELNLHLLVEYLHQFNNVSLEKRVGIFVDVYEL